MLKVYSFICIYLFVSAYGDTYTLTDTIGKFAFFAENKNGTRVSVKVYDGSRDLISTYMIPDGQQINEIAQVQYDGPCRLILEYNQLYDIVFKEFNNPMCIVIKYYSYKDINDLSQYMNIYNLEHTKDNLEHTKDNNHDKGTLDSLFDTIFIQILTALNYLHDPLSRKDTHTHTQTHTHTKSVIHMDMKPGNIFISSSPYTNSFECRLGDFELSVFGTSSHIPFAGTPMYYDPRRADLFLSHMDVNVAISQFKDKSIEKYFTNKSEVYAVGLMMFEFCYQSEPWYYDVTTASNLSKSYLFYLLMFKQSCFKQDKIKLMCNLLLKKEKKRLYSNRYQLENMHMDIIMHILYAEVITKFDATNLSYDMLTKEVVGNCSKDRFDLIKEMLQYNELNRPTAGEALMKMKEITKFRNLEFF
eukprot:GHVR01150944.1.p1 GENE.GHVR01150944.1~~GHVR01150944.1.p1  ORF type:complete len:416 (+),score=65.70 GHVR01150944.1:87-1334(+)